jgi:hypothetical protein
MPMTEEQIKYKQLSAKLEDNEEVWLLGRGKRL